MADIVNKWAAATITAPANQFSAISPSDSTDETKGPFRAIYVGVAGNIAVVGLDNTAVTFVGVIAGSIIPVLGRRVNSTNTTASSLVGLR